MGVSFFFCFDYSYRPDYHELFVLKEGEKKITTIKDTKIPNAATFVVKKEDHTVGNLLRMCVPPATMSTLPNPSPTL